MSEVLFHRKKSGTDMTLFEALNMVFQIQQKSRLCTITLNPNSDQLCHKCTLILQGLVTLYTQFIEASDSAMFLGQVLHDPAAVASSNKTRQVPVKPNSDEANDMLTSNSPFIIPKEIQNIEETATHKTREAPLLAKTKGNEQGNLDAEDAAEPRIEEKLIGRKYFKGVLKYRVKWLHLPYSKCTWVRESRLKKSCQHLIDKFSEDNSAAIPKSDWNNEEIYIETQDLIADTEKKFEPKTPELKQNLKDSESRIKNLNTEAEINLAKIASLTIDLNQKLQIATNLQRELDASKKTLSQLREEFEMSKMELKAAQEQNSNLLSQIEGLHSRLQLTQLYKSQMDAQLIRLEEGRKDRASLEKRNLELEDELKLVNLKSVTSSSPKEVQKEFKKSSSSEKSPVSSHTCTECKAMLRSPRYLELHMKKVHADPNSLFLACKFCGVIFSNRGTQSRHQKICPSSSSHGLKSSPRIFACETCGVKLTSLPRLLRHKKVHLVPNFRCKYCRAGFSTRVNRAWHQRQCQKRPLPDSS